MPTSANFFKQIPEATESERIETLFESLGFRVERIVSLGQASADGFWYDQPEDEWVMVLEGRARLEIAEPSKIVELAAGDWLSLPANCRHRVTWTDPERPTVWLAVHGNR
ncbi:MAG: cupin domain-containing protein [bacterium]|nr:cupin domain-containing protein [bacterium]